MNSSKALVISRMAAFGFSSLAKCRGMKQFRLDDKYYRPGTLQVRDYKRTWAKQQEREERMDDTKYNPGRWTEREYQATWREPVDVDEEPQEEVRDSRHREEPAPVPVRRRSFEPSRRLQRNAIPASKFISQFISTQEKNRMRNLEVAADRTACDEYQLV
ncbi:uncharacterized protein LOC128256906 [Drosophila gunungcola]|uniref:Uncharacterized protein n=1 Tax=Drosophila gunungcola TaxID=103775 RepID=A0A9P9YEY7_9MUSC|nr:uncharacterized protein LOC128256906 [Drosophila gunungcola]KAI8035754.1 hypothetical protein M5D96_011504 [Drosophila gunungcola]